MNMETAREKVRKVRLELQQAVADLMRLPPGSSFEQRIASLRRKTQLTRQLLDAQSELLLAIRTRPAPAIQNNPRSP